MRKLYFRALLSFFILWMFMYLPKVSSRLFYHTDGLAGYLWLIPTVTLYWFCFLPIVLLWKSKRLIGVGLSGCCFLSAAYFPFLYEEFKFRRAAEIITQTDLSNTKDITPRTIAFFNHTDFGGRFFKERDLCGSECRSLLLSESVDWVNVTSFFEIKTKRHGVTFVLKKGDDCSVHYHRSHDDKCIVIGPNPGEIAELEIHRDYNRTNWGKEIIDHTFFLTEITASTNNEKMLTRVYKQTDLSLYRISKPTRLYLGGDWVGASGVALGRENLDFNKISLDRTLRDLGYAIEKVLPRTSAHEMKYGPDVRMSREVLAVLALPDTDFFSEGTSLPIINWVMAVNNLEKIEPYHVDYLKRIIKETRIVKPSDIFRVFSNHEKLRDELLPTVFDVLEKNDYSSYKYQYMPARYILRNLDNFDRSVLMKYKTRLLKLADKYESFRSIIRKLDNDS
ncbi:MAG: hypothetical protein COC00_007425 [Rhizobiales bacterium]|nr:hypothetical protein [Hyphomicrobiales bacterium]